MNKRVVAVVVCTLLAMVAASLRVPTRIYARTVTMDSSGDLRYRPWGPTTEQWEVRFRWPGGLVPRHQIGGRPGTGPLIEERIEWVVLFAEHALILLLGGGLLTFVVRRERRRKALR